MARTRICRNSGLCLLTVLTGALVPTHGWSQATKNAAPAVVTIEQPDADRTRQELSRLLGHYPPSLRNVLALDPSLLSNETYLAPYPALAGYLNGHPEIARNPYFYVANETSDRRYGRSTRDDTWNSVLGALGAFVGFGMGIGLLTWLIRTLVDYRRWSRLSKVQTDVHTKLLDRFTANDDLLAYIQSPAGSKFLQSSPIMLDAGPRSVGAPLGRILWSVQAGLVLTALGIGLQMESRRVSENAAQPIHALGVVGIALGLGFVISAIISFMISYRLGLIEPAAPAPRTEAPGAQG